MDINRKKVLFMPLDVLTVSGKTPPEDVTDFRVRKEIVERIRRTRIARVVIICRKDYPFSQNDLKAILKTIEFFVFSYCQIAVSSHRGDGFLEEVKKSLPGNLKRNEYMLMVDNDLTMADEIGIDFMNLDDFLK